MELLRNEAPLSYSCKSFLSFSTKISTMTVAPVKVLLIEDDEDDVLFIKDYLNEIKTNSFDVYWEPQISNVRRQMLSGDYDVFLIDYLLGAENGLDMMQFIQQKRILTPAIILTGTRDIKVDTQASRYGAADFLLKGDLNASILERSIRFALSQAKIVRELDEQEKKYRSLFERSLDAIFLANQKLTVININGSFTKLLGYEVTDSIGLTIKDIFADQNDYEHVYKTLKEIEQVKDFEVRLLTQSGELKVCLLNCVFIPDQASEFCCYQGIIHDLTDRKQNEIELMHAERLAITGKIARTIAHEVRNPLANLNLAFHHLLDKVPQTDESVVLYGDIIQRNSNRIEQLINDMLSSSKPDTLNLEHTSIEQIIEDTVSLAIDRIKLNRIELRSHIPEELPGVLVDRDKIKIALLNILVNAVEAMQPEKGILEINALFCEATKKIEIHIRDNGKGISSDNLSKLFEPFFTSKPTGMGLGLTTTKNILNSHNAKLKVKSELNSGTVFIIQLRISD